MANSTLTALRKLVRSRFGGVLKSGKHLEDGQACALECLSVLRGVQWTDDPQKVRSFDLRSLNDLAVSDGVRTKHLLPVMAAYDGSLDWSKERQQEVATRLAIGVVNALISELACLPTEIAKACREAKTKDEAASAARSAESAAWSAESAARRAAWSAESAAWSAAWSAEWSAESAESAALERVFIAACKVWLDAVKD